MKKVIQNFCNYSRYERELDYIQTCKYCFGVLKKYEKQLEALQALHRAFIRDWRECPPINLLEK